MAPKVEEVDFADYFTKSKQIKQDDLPNSSSLRDEFQDLKKNKNFWYILIIVFMIAGIYVELKYFYMPLPSKDKATFQEFQQLHPNIKQQIPK